MDDQTTTQPRANFASLWSIPLLCAGLSVMAACVLLPAAEANRKLSAQCATLQGDLTYVHRQLAVNDAFLQRVGVDPGLAERLAQRQMKEIRQGASVLPLRSRPSLEPMSPFLLVAVDRPALSPYQPSTGLMGSLSRNNSFQLYLSGIALFMIAGGLILGGSTRNA